MEPIYLCSSVRSVFIRVPHNTKDFIIVAWENMPYLRTGVLCRELQKFGPSEEYFRTRS